MLVSPFMFYRGAEAFMAEDLASTPHSGLQDQWCGDARLAGREHQSAGVGMSEKRGSAARHSASGMPSSPRTMLVPRTSDTIL